MDDEENYAAHVIPDNVTDSGKILNGVFKKRNLFEAIAFAGPLALILWYVIPIASWSNKVPYVMIPTACVFIIGVVGFPPYSILEFANLAFKFNKTKHYAKYNPRLKWEGVPKFLINSPYISLFDAIANLFEGVSTGNIEEEHPVDENIYAPKHIERFNDDFDEEMSARDRALAKKQVNKHIKEKYRQKKHPEQGKKRKTGLFGFSGKNKQSKLKMKQEEE